MNEKCAQSNSNAERRLFILGAGFSAAAGIPLTSALLNQAMQRFRYECKGVYQRVRNYTQIAFGLGDAEPDYSVVDFAKLCTFLHYIELRESGGAERFSDHGCREILALRHYLAKVIAAATPEPGDVGQLYKA